MDMKARAELVRKYREADLKGPLIGPGAMINRQFQRRRDPAVEAEEHRRVMDAESAPAGSRRRTEMARTRERFRRVRPGETGDDYINRTAEGGDSSYGDAAARYDLRRGAGTQPAPTWDDGYTSYNGWADRARRGRGRRSR